MIQLGDRVKLYLSDSPVEAAVVLALPEPGRPLLRLRLLGGDRREIMLNPTHPTFRGIAKAEGQTQ